MQSKTRNVDQSNKRADVKKIIQRRTVLTNGKAYRFPFFFNLFEDSNLNKRLLNHSPFKIDEIDLKFKTDTWDKNAEVL